MPDLDESSPLDMRKGDRVVLKGGAAKKFPRYISAYIDKARPITHTLQPVIVLTRDGAYKLFRPKKKNVKPYEAYPTTRVEAAFQQHPRLDELMTNLARYLATCQIGREHDNGYVMDRFAHALDSANDEIKDDVTIPLRRVVWAHVDASEDGMGV